jgi:hypothetical protein
MLGLKVNNHINGTDLGGGLSPPSNVNKTKEIYYDGKIME